MNKNDILRRAVLTVLTLLWMLLIFAMSGADQDESNAQSGTICTFLCETFVEGFDELSPREQQAIEEAIAFPVRKGANLTEYTVLGMLLAAAAAAYTFNHISVPFLIGVIYAVSDEIHQLCVPGRAGQFRDVLIDSAGVLLGICIYRAAARRRRIRVQRPGQDAFSGERRGPKKR